MPIPPQGLPRHSIEAGYILDLITAAKIALLKIEMQFDHPRVDAEMVAAWSLVHRSAVARCRGEGRLHLHRTPAHETAVTVIDAFVILLKKGLEEGHPAKYLMRHDLEQARQAYDQINACEDSSPIRY